MSRMIHKKGLLYMPVTITQNTDGTVDVSGKITTNKKITPKYYHSALTGSPQSISRGYFTSSSHTVAQKQEDNAGLPEDELNQVSRQLDNTNPTLITNKYVDENWTLVKISPSQLTPTLLHTSEITDISFTNTTLPRNTLQSNLHALSTWSEIYKTTGLTIMGSADILQIAEFQRKPINATTTLKQFSFLEQYNLVLFTGTIDDIQEFKYIDIDSVSITNINELRHPLNTTYTNKHTALVLSAIEPHRFMQLMAPTHPDKTTFNSNIEKLPETTSVYTNLSQHATLIEQFKVQHIKEHTALLRSIAQNTSERQLYKALTQLIQHVNYFDSKDKTFFNVSDITEIYQEIKSFEDILDSRIIDSLLKLNIRILLASNIAKLQENKNNLYRPNTNTTEWQNIKTKWTSNPDYSAQQRNIILSEEPLIIAQAGAGSGKSHTVVGRLNYLQEQNEDLSNVLVLSFTNAAADNIKERFPAIQSETLARMFDTIYHETYPKQELVSIETFYNTLRLIDENAPVFQNIPSDTDPQRTYSAEDIAYIITRLSNIARDFSMAQISYKRIDHNALTAQLVTLISKYTNAIEAIMDAIGQTTLELEPILIHHHLAKETQQLTIPSKYQNINYIITDESQDISTFEYNLLLEFVNTNQAQFLIVGDGSQTLYEFRSSDPRYMNALEASGVFTTYKLETNYRSKQAILSYANEFLKVISANEIAQIQLQANDKSELTLNDLDESVILRDIPLDKANEYHERLETIFEIEDIRDYVLDKINKGEQIAIVGYTRAELNIIQAGLKKLLEENNITTPIESLIPDKASIAAIWTTSIARANKDLRTLGVTANINNEIRTLLTQAISQAYNSRSPRQKAFYQTKINETLDQLFMTHQWSYMRNQYLTRVIKIGGLLSYLYNYFVRVEKREIAASNYLQSKDTINVKDSKIILSTIHRVKGFEFDHVVTLHNAHKTKSAHGSSLQELFRMYFVALSRAKKSEMIINVSPCTKHISNDTMFDFPMETAHYLLTNQLENHNAN